MALTDDQKVVRNDTGKRIATALERIADGGNEVADAYSSSATYAVGDYCIYNNTLYKCSTAITTAEAWTPAHWTATTVADELHGKLGPVDVVNNLTNTITKTVGPSDMVTITDGEAGNALDVTIGINPVQSGSGDPSPSNIRPITGWTNANVVVSPSTSAAAGTTYPVSWQSTAGTVYGGTLDVTTGLLTVISLGAKDARDLCSWR